MKKIITALACVIALVVGASAHAAGPSSWWSEDAATVEVLDSNWSFEHAVEDADCSGFGGYKIGPDGSQLFDRFVCVAWADGTGDYCWTGECSGASMLAETTLRIRSISASKFIIISAVSTLQ